jgi:hypothetical protein
MGNMLQTDLTWYVYRRVLSTDEWVQEPLQKWTGTNMADALSQFKHEAYTFALAKHVQYEDTKSVYLYQGNVRIAKANLDAETGQLQLWSTAIREWLASPEMLASNRYPLLEKVFFTRYLKQYAWVSSQAVAFIKKE